MSGIFRVLMNKIIESKVYCAILDDWCDRRRPADKGDCGEDLGQFYVCRHASEFNEDHINQIVKGGDVVEITSPNRNTLLTEISSPNGHKKTIKVKSGYVYESGKNNPNLTDQLNTKFPFIRQSK